MGKPTQKEEEEDNKFTGNFQDGQIDVEEIRLAQEEDEVLQEVKRWVERDPPTKQALRVHPEGYHDYFKQLKSLHFNDGRVLMLQHRGGTLPEDQRDRIVIPNQENL